MILNSLTPKGCYDWMYDSTHVMLLTEFVRSDADYVQAALNHPECYKSIAISEADIYNDEFTLDDFCDLADAVNADELVLPYKFADTSINKLEVVKEIIEYLRDNDLSNKYRLMAICNASGETSFYEQFNAFNNIPEITCIGIPSFKWVNSRADLYDIWKNTDKEIHFLGAGKSFKEIIDLPDEIFYKVRSCSTSLPFEYALSGKSILDDSAPRLLLNKKYSKLTRKKYDAAMREYMNYNNMRR